MAGMLTGLNKYSARLRSESKRIETEGAQIAQDAAEFGAELMRQFIRTRGTGWRGHTGRIESGDMLRAVGVGQPRKLKNGVAISFGWGVDGKPVENYFFFQEVGFRNTPPMHALLDALVQSRQYFYARIKEVI